MTKDRVEPQDRVPGLDQIPRAQGRQARQHRRGQRPPDMKKRCQHTPQHRRHPDSRDDEWPDHHGVRVSQTTPDRIPDEDFEALGVSAKRVRRQVFANKPDGVPPDLNMYRLNRASSWRARIPKTGSRAGTVVPEPGQP